MSDDKGEISRAVKGVQKNDDDDDDDEISNTLEYMSYLSSDADEMEKWSMMGLFPPPTEQ